MGKLVIVESPAKARTISGILGAGYDVQASFGHVRDLPEGADQIPEAVRKEKWARLGVNVDHDFEPLYVVPTDKKRHVDNLKRSAKDATELLLATDGDREGESISWHILQLLKPKKSIPVRRIIFHELTPEAIHEAVDHPGVIDERLVRAQETRRILDRLYGYSLSPLLWKKIAPKLSAGRVQSVAVRLCVERERERMRFRSAEYWDLVADLKADRVFRTNLARVEGKPVATGASFDATTGLLKDQRVVLLDRPGAESLTERAKSAQPWTVTKQESTPGTETPPVPFMTSTLQQEANRKLRLPARRTMQIAQQLYEGIDLGGERVGLITYMRTDSLNLADRALTQARVVIEDLYGKDYLPKNPVRYKTKAKGAQEAHEAIRPTDLSRRPQDLKRHLTDEQFALYDLIWKRTIACQMVPARVLRTQVEVSVTVDDRPLVFAASGKQIVFAGFLKAYVEGSDDPDAELGGRETLLPVLTFGQTLDVSDVQAQEHHTRPPARYTEASLVKRLEDEGVGRPSTYASILGTIQDRGYITKKGNELIPTFTAIAVTELLENNFHDLVDLKFTAKLEEELDDIATGEVDWVAALKAFYFGDESEAGLAPQIQQRERDIPYPALELGSDPHGQPVVVRVGRFGTFVQRGEGGTGHRANVPEDIAPADLSLERALDLIDQRASGPEAIAVDPSTGQCIFHRKGRFGPYLEVAQSDEERERGDTPRRITLPKGLNPAELDESDLALLMSLPKTLGQHPELDEPVVATIGQYGPYVRAGKEIRNVDDWRAAARLSYDDALVLLSQPKVRRTRQAATPVAPLREFGVLEGAQGPVRVLDGRFGPYVTDGTTNATLPKGTDPGALTPDEAMDLIRARAAAGPPAKKRRFGAGKAAGTGKAGGSATKSRAKTTTRRPKSSN